MSAPAPKPAYIRICDQILRDIAAGRLIDGDRLPPEREMAAGLGVAVGTLRKALARLETAGRLVRRHGSGNYIAGSAPPAGEAVARLCALNGAPLAVAVLSDETLPPPADWPGRAAVRRVRRLHRAAGLAVAVEETWDAGAREVRQVEDSVSMAPLPSWGPPSFRPSVACHLRRVETAGDGTACRVGDIWFDPARVVYRARVR